MSIYLYDDFYIIKTKSHLFKHLINHIEKTKLHETAIVLEDLELGVLVIVKSNGLLVNCLKRNRR